MSQSRYCMTRRRWSSIIFGESSLWRSTMDLRPVHSRKNNSWKWMETDDPRLELADSGFILPRCFKKISEQLRILIKLDWNYQFLSHQLLIHMFFFKSPKVPLTFQKNKARKSTDFNSHSNSPKQTSIPNSQRTSVTRFSWRMLFIICIAQSFPASHFDTCSKKHDMVVARPFRKLEMRKRILENVNLGSPLIFMWWSCALKCPPQVPSFCSGNGQGDNLGRLSPFGRVKGETCWWRSSLYSEIDGRNPKQPPGM